MNLQAIRILFAGIVVLADLGIVLAGPDQAPARPEVPAAVVAAEAARVAVMTKAKESVLAIFGADDGGGGSGVVISADGYALTNFHVAKPVGNALKCGMADGQVYDAVVVGLDPTGDVALIKLFGRDDFPHAEMADSDQIRVGDWAFAMGNPFLLATDFQPTVTYGIISGTHRYQFPSGTILEYTDCLQTDASINPGNSGGPLFDAQGRLIGINGRASFEKRGRVNVGAAYAISINQVKNFLGYLRSGRIVDHATLGARAGFDAEGRVVVTDILESSDAYRRGLRLDDEIVAFGGRPITTPNGFKNVLGIFPALWRVPLSFRREGKRHDVLVRLPALHGHEELLRNAEGRPGGMPIPKPDDKPEPEGKPGKKPDRDEKGQKPLDVLPHHRPAPMPEVVKAHFEAKRGYANYYFNKLHQQRVWKAWSARGDFSSLRGAWVLGGELARGGRFQFRLDDRGGKLQLPDGQSKWTVGDALTASSPPPGSGGLLPALYLWRRLATEGLGRFGEVYYLGTVPLAGTDGQADVLVGLHQGAECHFLFDPATGSLLAVEMFAEEDADPCAIRFSDYQQVDGRWLPSRMEIRHGDELFATLKFDEHRLEKK